MKFTAPIHSIRHATKSKVSRYISKTTQSMSTIQVTKEWQPQPTKNLVEINPVEEGKKITIEESGNPLKSSYCAEDVMGLSWVLSDDLEAVFNGNDIW